MPAIRWDTRKVVVFPSRLWTALRSFASVAKSSALELSSRIRISGFFYQRTRNRKTLFLSAGEVLSVLLQHKIELILFAFYDFFRLGCGERLPDFCISGVLFAPLHIVADAAFKEHCSLLNNTDFIAELFFRVILYILAFYHDVTAGRIVETGNQADQRRFSASGTADDSDGLAAFCGKADIR